MVVCAVAGAETGADAGGVTGGKVACAVVGAGADGAEGTVGPQSGQDAGRELGCRGLDLRHDKPAAIARTTTITHAHFTRLMRGIVHAVPAIGRIVNAPCRVFSSAGVGACERAGNAGGHCYDILPRRMGRDRQAGGDGRSAL